MDLLIACAWHCRCATIDNDYSWRTSISRVRAVRVLTDNRTTVSPPLAWRRSGAPSWACEGDAWEPVIRDRREPDQVLMAVASQSLIDKDNRDARLLGQFQLSLLSVGTGTVVQIVGDRRESRRLGCPAAVGLPACQVLHELVGGCTVPVFLVGCAGHGLAGTCFNDGSVTGADECDSRLVQRCKPRTIPAKLMTHQGLSATRGRCPLRPMCSEVLQAYGR